MNKLSRTQRKRILQLLVEGSSMRAISRLEGVSINTVAKLLVDAGGVCADFHDDTVRELNCSQIQCDEIWSFCYAKEKNVDLAINPPMFAGDVWTWTAIDPDSILIVAYYIGTRESDCAFEFLCDIYDRLNKRVQVTTDGLRSYVEAIEEAFEGEIDYAQVVKVFPTRPHIDSATGFSDQAKIGMRKQKILGSPSDAKITTNHVERQNLTMRMSMRRFTRSINGFSKKLDNHFNMLAIYFVYYNFCRIHKSLRITPAMEAGICDTAYDLGLIVDLLEAEEAKRSRKRGPYKKRTK